MDGKSQHNNILQMPFFSNCYAKLLHLDNYAPACLCRSGVTSLRAHVCMSRSKSNVTVDLQVYIDIYVHVSLGVHNFGDHHSIPFKFGMILT